MLYRSPPLENLITRVTRCVGLIPVGLAAGGPQRPAPGPLSPGLQARPAVLRRFPRLMHPGLPPAPPQGGAAKQPRGGRAAVYDPPGLECQAVQKSRAARGWPARALNPVCNWAVTRAPFGLSVGWKFSGFTGCGGGGDSFLAGSRATVDWGAGDTRPWRRVGVPCLLAARVHPESAAAQEPPS